MHARSEIRLAWIMALALSAQLDSAAAFERYSMRLLALIERSLRTCTLVDTGKSAFDASDVLRHLLPRVASRVRTPRALCADPGARLFPAQIAAFQAGASSWGHGAPVDLPDEQHAGGQPPGQVWATLVRHRPDSMHISPRLRARIEQVFRMDVELLEAMHAGEMTESKRD